MTLTQQAKSALRYIFVCPFCKIRFASQDDLSRHNCFSHSTTIKFNFMCKHCDRIFELQESMKKHAIICKKRPLVSQSQSNERKVMKTCLNTKKVPFKIKSEKNFDLISSCNKLFPMKNEKNKVNVPELPNSTGKNSKAQLLSTNSSLARNSNKISSTSSSVQENDEKPHRCNVCGSCFKYDFSLYAHLSSHPESERQAAENFMQAVRCHEDGASELEAVEIRPDEDSSNQALIDFLCASVDGAEYKREE